MLHAHVIFVLATGSTLDPEHVECIENRLGPLCSATDVELLQAQAVDDQLHLLIEYPPALKLTDLLESFQASLKDWQWSPNVFIGSSRRPDLVQQMREFLQSVRASSAIELQ